MRDIHPARPCAPDRTAQNWRALALLAVLLFANGHLASGQSRLSEITPATAAVREESFRLRMTSRALVDRAYTLAQQGELQHALTLFTDAIERDPTFAPAYFFRAATHLQRRDFAAALMDLDSVIDRAPDFAAALNDRGFARWQTGDFSGAVADFDRCIAIRGDWGLPYANRATLKAQLGDPTGAILDADEALRLDPSLAEQTNDVRGSAH